jgi:hypothetical protein
VYGIEARRYRGGVHQPPARLANGAFIVAIAVVDKRFFYPA